MKKIIFELLTIAIVTGCNTADKSAKEGGAIQDSTIAQNINPATNSESDPANLTSIEWLDTQERDLGKIKEGQKLEVSFRFKNIGKNPLIVSKVWAQCGCTVAETPKEPYAPGQEGVIKAIFDSQGKPGLNQKEVYANTNTDPVTNVLIFKVDVKKSGL